MPRETYRPIEGGRILMPDRGYVEMPSAGARIDPGDPHYARLIREGSLVKVGAAEATDPVDDPTDPDTEDTPPAQTRKAKKER